MTAASATEVLIAAPDIDDRVLECLADCGATLVRTFDEAKQALRERLFKLIVIDLNFDEVRMFDLLHHVRSLADCDDVPVVCVQASEAGAGLGAAFDRLVDVIYAVSSTSLHNEFASRGWPPKAYQNWLTDELTRLLESR